VSSRALHSFGFDSKTARLAASLLAVAVLWAFLPSHALAQKVSETLLDEVINYFGGLGAVINNRILGWAQTIFLICASIQIALILWNIMLEEISRRSLSSGGVRGLLKKLLLYSIFITFSGWLLTNNRDVFNGMTETFHDQLAPWVISQACFAPAATAGAYNPPGSGEIIEVGWWMYESSNENFMLAVGASDFTDTTSSGNPDQVEDDSWWDWTMKQTNLDDISSWAPDPSYIFDLITTPTSWIILLAAALIIPTFYVIAFQVLIAEITLRMITAFLPIVLAFLPLTFLSPLISGYIRYWLYTLLKLFFIYILLIPVLKIPSMIIASTSNASMGNTQSPLDACAGVSGGFLDNPGSFSGFTQVGDPNSFRDRADLALVIAALLLAGASLLKTIPERLATFMTQQFSLRPLYDIIE
jgi:hypothetical protein